jgi:hypothetical protein
MFNLDDTALANEIWAHLDNRDQIAWRLRTLEGRAGQHRITSGILEHTRRLSRTLTPRMLLKATLAIAPEGTTRPAEIVKFEKAILNCCTKDGAWRW